MEAQPTWEIVAEAADGIEAVTQAFETRPDIAIVDYSLPLLSGIEVTKRIRKRLPETEVLIFTLYDNESLIRKLLQAGARGYLLKSDANAALLTAVEALAAHKPYFTPNLSEALLESFLAHPDHLQFALTPRERGVVQLVAEGHSNKQMANVLNISIKTVESHRSTVMRKLNMSSTASLVRYAVRNRLVEP